MMRRADDDKLEGKFGAAQRMAPSSKQSLPGVSGNKRQRAAWFNRARGQGGVKLKVERPAGSQRVIVKIKPVVHARLSGGGGGAGSLMRHALYVERDGAGREGDAVSVFDAEHDRADGAAFVERCEDDRHHFRVIISPEYGEDFADLKSYTRELVDQVGRDLHTRLDWIAAAHHDTGRPHVHLLIRGRHEDGRDLVIPRPYISHSFRERAEALATRELGPRIERGRELDQSLARASELKRLTHLDRTLMARAEGRELRLSALPDDDRERAALVRRLNRLEDLGLVERTSGDRWRLDPELGSKLSRMGEAQARDRATAKLLAREDRGLEPGRVRALEQAHSAQRVWGRLVGVEPIGTGRSGPYLVGVEALDGRFWTARVASEQELRVLNGVERGAIIELSRDQPGLRASDRTILEVAGDDRTYSVERHKEHAPKDRDSYIDMHVRRLEALRVDGIVSRDRDGVFHLPGDYKEQVLQREARGGLESARIEVLDRHALTTQEQYRGPALLDRALEGRLDLSQVRADGFGRDLLESAAQRQETLKHLGLGRDTEAGFALDKDAARGLRGLERENLLAQVERESGRVAHFARENDRVAGVFVSRIHGAERSFAVIAQGDTATLAPWRPEMDRAFNQTVSGQVRGREFDFQYGREAEKSIAKGLGLGR